MDSNTPTDRSQTDSPQSSPREPDASKTGDLWSRLRPRLAAGMRNLRVWAPVLANPHQRACQVRYPSRDYRVGLVWDIVLAEQCWQCGCEQGLESKQFRQTVRGFENPLEILLTTLVLSALLFLLGLWLWLPFVVISLGVLAAGGAAMAIKSWREEVRLVMSTCADHAAEVESPEAVLWQDDLVITVRTEALAQAARAELIEKRKARTPAGVRAGRAAAEAGVSAPAPTPPPRSAPPAPKIDLPPIKLAGEEDEAPSPADPTGGPSADIERRGG